MHSVLLLLYNGTAPPCSSTEPGSSCRICRVLGWLRGGRWPSPSTGPPRDTGSGPLPGLAGTSGSSGRRNRLTVVPVFDAACSAWGPSTTTATVFQPKQYLAKTVLGRHQQPDHGLLPAAGTPQAGSPGDSLLLGGFCFVHSNVMQRNAGPDCTSGHTDRPTGSGQAGPAHLPTDKPTTRPTTNRRPTGRAPPQQGLAVRCCAWAMGQASSAACTARARSRLPAGEALTQAQGLPAMTD